MIYDNHAMRNRILQMATLLIILAIATVSCRDDQEKSKSNSRFLEELKKQAYTETKPPKRPPVFRWDFSQKKVYTYTYEQEMRIKTDMTTEADKEIDTEQSMSTKGALLIKSHGNGTADLVLKDMKMSTKMDVGNDEEPKSMDSTMPPIVMQGMKEDGSGSLGDSSRLTCEELLLKLLFSLPTKSLKAGESVDIPVQMPFNVMGSRLPVKGHSRITLTRYVKIGDRTCAQLDVDTDISELKVPSELEGEYSCSLKGTSVFYFDVANRCFVAGTNAVVMQFKVDAPMPKIDIPGEESADMPERMKMSMAMDSLIRVFLKE